MPIASDSQKQPDHASARFPVVGIGASAGGLEACIEFLSALPPTSGMAYVIVQHLEPHHESHLPEILSRATPLPVVPVHDILRVERDHVYVVPPNVVLSIQQGTLRLSPRPESADQYYPIDHFFASLAEDQKSCAIGVILSGSASDGAQGLRKIKDASGTTCCQTEESAKFTGMPHSAIETGAVDFILPPHALAIEVVRIGAHPTSDDLELHDPDLISQEPDDESISKLLALLRNATKVDFTQYKQSTIRRRISKRMLLHNVATAREYLAWVESHPSEPGDLYRDLLIGVTQFFREPAAFEALSRMVAAMLPNRNPNTLFRIWSAGCATGEEAYSLAMAITEVIEAAGLPTRIQLFGTDISDVSIDRARAAVYPDAIRQDLSPERLARFFTRADNGYRIVRSIRENCIFARHDLVRDPPFSQLDVVSCRNVLIYLETPAQHRVLQAIHFSLKRDGLLLMGSAETTGLRTDLFAPRDSENKIFGRKSSASRLTVTLPDPQRAAIAVAAPGPTEAASSPVQPSALANVEIRAARIRRNLYAPPGVTVDESMQIVHFHGETSPYLEPPSGEASLNLFRVVHQGLFVAIRKAIDCAAEQKEAVVENGVRFERGGQTREISIRVIPISEGDRCFYLILFEDPASRPPSRPVPSAAETASVPSDSELGRTRRELDETREYLRGIIEQHEVAIEELRAANEEVQSSNEEIQSANEELRTATEELQSSNEELITVNEELKNLNAELGSANDDLANVLSAVSIPVVMVGMDLKIRRHTPAAERLLITSSSDLGRIISDVHYAIDVPNLTSMLAEAIRNLTVQHSAVRDPEGRWFSVIVRPYRTVDHRIDGAVVTFIDIDEETRALERAEAARDFAEGMVETVQHPLLVLDSELRIQRVTSAFYKVFSVTPEETEGQLIFEVGNGQWNIPRLRTLLNEALVRDVAFQDLDVELDFPRIGRRTMRLNARRIARRAPSPQAILLAIEDVTERKEAAEIQYRRIFETAKDAIVVIDAPSGRVTDVNQHFIELTRYPREEIVGRLFSEIPPFLKVEEGRTLVPECLQKEVVRYESVRLQAQDNRYLIVEMIANRYRVRDQVYIQINIRDVTERRQADEDLRRSNLDLQQFAFAASHDLQEPLRTVINQVQLLQKLYGGNLGPDADEIIHFITSATDRMRQMVLDLLSFAQTARAAIVVVPVRVESVLAMTIANLQLAIESTGARITFDHLPVIMMDQTQLLQLLQNLIGNALKYRGAEPPRIHLSARAQGDEEWMISVADNGIGIDPRFHEHIFTVFKRLHGPEYPGTGIGLATCKRIVERHGGRIWVESQPDQGAIFSFTAKAAPRP